MIKIFGISGSPRNGSTDYIVNEALKYLEEKYGAKTRYFPARGKYLNFCIHCDYCIRERSGCTHKEDMPEFYDGLEWADGIIIGTPVYQGNPSAQTKTMLDRVGGQEIDFQSTPRESFGANWVLPSGLRTGWLKARMRMKRSYVPCARPQTG